MQYLHNWTPGAPFGARSWQDAVMQGGSTPLLTSDALWSRSSRLKESPRSWSVSPSSGSPVGWLSGEMAKDQYLRASERQIVSPGMSNNRGFEAIGDQLHRSIPYRTLTFIISLLITSPPFSGETLSPFSEASNQSCRGIANADLPFSATWKAKESKTGWGRVALPGKDSGQACRLCEIRQLRLDKTSSKAGTGQVRCVAFSLSPASQCFWGLLVF